MRSWVAIAWPVPGVRVSLQTHRFGLQWINIALFYCQCHAGRSSSASATTAAARVAVGHVRERGGDRGRGPASCIAPASRSRMAVRFT
jgi:hypothetical protein